MKMKQFVNTENGNTQQCNTMHMENNIPAAQVKFSLVSVVGCKIFFFSFAYVTVVPLLLVIDAVAQEMFECSALIGKNTV
uniref:Transmembrane protein n=1 Tax=Octopus bimaculoides TaxID=37653 RepID=A0A0L8G7F1_OCTBM